MTQGVVCFGESAGHGGVVSRMGFVSWVCGMTVDTKHMTKS